MPEPAIDHIIAVHDVRRPIARAVGSVLAGTKSPLRVTVVCHNLGQDAVAEALAAHVDDPRLRLVELADGIPSPSGPFNAGLDLATARYTSIMGSDDSVETGALDSWLALAERTASDVVIPRVTVVGRGPMLTPPARVGRTRALDGVRDRLAYRTSPLGLVSRARFGDLRFPAGLRSGIDVEYGNRLWFSDARIAFDRRGPSYLVHEDAPVRVSTVAKPVAADASFLEGLLRGDVFRSLTSTQRDAVVTKMLRGNVLMWITYRPTEDLWSADDVIALGEVVRRCADIAPAAFRPLSRTDRDILDAFAAPTPDLRKALALLPGRTAIRPRNVVPRSIGAFLHREAPPRFGLASKLLGRGI
ncbi:glycosyltransferase [Microbacterium sp. HJ5]